MKIIRLVPIRVSFIATLFTLLLGFAHPVHAITPEQVVSPGGIKAWFVPDHTNPILSFKFAFKGGSALDPEGKEGLSNIVSGLLDEGAGEIDSKAFQQTLEDLAISLRFSSGRDQFGGNLQTLVRNQDTAFNLLKLAITQNP